MLPNSIAYTARPLLEKREKWRTQRAPKLLGLFHSMEMVRRPTQSVLQQVLRSASGPIIGTTYLYSVIYLTVAKFHWWPEKRCPSCITKDGVLQRLYKF